MVAYMDREALERTLATGEVHFHSRSRCRLWRKGETSGNVQRVREIYLDCDKDTLLILVDGDKPACHTGRRSCFFRRLRKGKWEIVRRDKDRKGAGLQETLEKVYAVILDRKKNPRPGSYVASLFSGGRDRILKKIAEEAGELMLGAKNGRKSEVIHETADLLFHTLVVLGERGIRPAEIAAELERRYHRPK